MNKYVKTLQEKIASQEMQIEAQIDENAKLRQELDLMREQIGLSSVKARLNDSGFLEYVERTIN